MSSNARNKILKRLNHAAKTGPVSSFNEKNFRQKEFSQTEKLEMLRSLMEAMRTEVHVCNPDSWIDVLKEISGSRGLKDLLYSPGTEIGKLLAEKWGENKDGLPELVPYEEDIEHFKARLFEIDAAITTTKGAIADTGAVILWPDKKEPRTMSLVPPVHIAFLKKEKIYRDLSEAISKERWAAGMPANALLISGPSKTADIELTLAYGVHGPKEMILLIV